MRPGEVDAESSAPAANLGQRQPARFVNRDVALVPVSNRVRVQGSILRQDEQTVFDTFPKPKRARGDARGGSVAPSLSRRQTDREHGRDGRFGEVKHRDVRGDGYGQRARPSRDPVDVQQRPVHAVEGPLLGADAQPVHNLSLGTQREHVALRVARHGEVLVRRGVEEDARYLEFHAAAGQGADADALLGARRG